MRAAGLRDLHGVRLHERQRRSAQPGVDGDGGGDRTERTEAGDETETQEREQARDDDQDPPATQPIRQDAAQRRDDGARQGKEEAQETDLQTGEPEVLQVEIEVRKVDTENGERSEIEEAERQRSGQRHAGGE